MNKYREILLIAVLVFPLLALGSMALLHHINQGRGDHVWRISLEGYDPRDLLHGHYLVFRYDWNLEASTSDESPPAKIMETCLCLNQGDNGYTDPLARPVSCEAPEANACQSILKAWQHGGLYSLNRKSRSERYFIPEENAYDVERMLRRGKHDFHMELITRPDGSASVRGLYVDGRPLEDHLRGMR